MLAKEERLVISETAQPAGEGAGRTPIFIVCSPRPRVGRTLIARLLTEYLITDGRGAEAFDINPDDPALTRFLPNSATRLAIGDTFGEMALFDRLIVGDGRPKIVDLSHRHFEPFFDLVTELGFVAEARAHAIDITVLYVAENHALSSDGFRRLQHRFPGIVLVPVHNQAIEAFDIDEFPSSQGDSAVVRIPGLSPHLQGVIDRPGFSFAEHLLENREHPTGLSHWTGRVFIAFRDLELRAGLEQIGRLFATAAEPEIEAEPEPEPVAETAK